MTRATRDSLMVVGYTLAGMLATAVAGWVTLGPIVFNRWDFLLRYLVVGFSGALIYLGVRTRAWGHALVMAGVLFIGYVVLGGQFSAKVALNAAIWTVPVAGMLILSSWLFGVLGRTPFGKFLLMGLLLGVGYGIGAFAWLALNPMPLTAANVLGQAIGGLRLGGLLGFVLEAMDFVRSRINGDVSPFRER
ncbi:hypothetical protein JXB37_07860 [candidate division WOR-3 bacterium]|nr:hypothetical protein [candidate division WOR-3 bacterium]